MAPGPDGFPRDFIGLTGLGNPQVWKTPVLTAFLHSHNRNGRPFFVPRPRHPRERIKVRVHCHPRLRTQRASSAVALLDRAIHSGRDVFELLAVEVIPVLRRMLVAASVLERGGSAGEIALALGLAPTSSLAMRAVDGARRFGSARLWHPHRRACELDAAFKMGLVKEREQHCPGCCSS
jgi:hypothetical protein